jgi:hypothetical protein
MRICPVCGKETQEDILHKIQELRKGDEKC